MYKNTLSKPFFLTCAINYRQCYSKPVHGMGQPISPNACSPINTRCRSHHALFIPYAISTSMEPDAEHETEAPDPLGSRQEDLSGRGPHMQYAQSSNLAGARQRQEFALIVRWAYPEKAQTAILCSWTSTSIAINPFSTAQDIDLFATSYTITNIPHLIAFRLSK